MPVFLQVVLSFMVEFVKHLCKLKKELKFFMKWPFNKFIYVV